MRATLTGRQLAAMHHRAADWGGGELKLAWHVPDGSHLNPGAMQEVLCYLGAPRAHLPWEAHDRAMSGLQCLHRHRDSARTFCLASGPA